LRNDIRKIAFVGDYAPRRCGIATFTHDLHAALAGGYPGCDAAVVAVTDRPAGYAYPDEVRFDLLEGDRDGYARAADFVNLSGAEVVCLQHEYGIYGGDAGEMLLDFLARVEAPVVTTLHTVLERPDGQQRRVLDEIVRRSSAVVTMTAKGRSLLREVFRVPGDRIKVIPHGVPDSSFVDSSYYKDQFGIEGRTFVLTFGLLSPNKGIEMMIEALPEVIRLHPNVVYGVVGVTHPQLLREEGEAYRVGLQALAKALGVGDHVIFFNRFVAPEELLAFIAAADIYVTPYRNEAQITSGTLAYSFGMGKAVISTPYWHATELLAEGRGLLVPFDDPGALAGTLNGLLADEVGRNAMRKRAYQLGRAMIWPRCAERYMTVLQWARRARPTHNITNLVRLPRPLMYQLPEPRFEHLEAMTDSTGLLQHAVYSVGDRNHGYCIDDNARALIVMTLAEAIPDCAEVATRLAPCYAAFVHHAWNDETKRFRNFMSYDRRWLEDAGSEDSHCRGLWALGTCVGRSTRGERRRWAAELFGRALGACEAMTSPRAWAFSLLGINGYLSALGGDRAAARIRDVLVERLLSLYRAQKGDSWLWFEDVLCYDNARLPQALLTAARATGQAEARDVGLEALDWLMHQQQAEDGHFRPIGSQGFYHRGDRPAFFDQQPIEAYAAVDACLEAYRLTGEAVWFAHASRAFEWFLGNNDLGEPLFDPKTGACRDGLHPDRVNENQGAESTLAFVATLIELKLATATMDKPEPLAWPTPVPVGS
jgi:glycosyltransferase involved in cell wall biosynthesis